MRNPRPEKIVPCPPMGLRPAGTSSQPGRPAVRFTAGFTAGLMARLRAVGLGLGLGLGLGVGLAALTAAPVNAQVPPPTQALAQAPAYPTRAVRIVIPYAPGGGADAVTRLLAASLGKTLGQPFVVEARAGGNTAIAAVTVARAPADGYTLLLTGGTTVALMPLVADKLPYDPLVDFAPIGTVSTSPYFVAASGELGATTLEQMLDKARARPGELAYASNGIGGSVHLGMELLASRANVKLTHVPYKGFAPALPDVISGRTPITMIDLAPLGGFVKSGQIRLLAVTSLQRSPQMPDVPTVAELGYPGFEIETWFALYAPAGTPPSIITQLNDAMRQWYALPETDAAMKQIGHTQRMTTPDEVRQRIIAEQKMYAPLVKASNIKMTD